MPMRPLLAAIIVTAMAAGTALAALAPADVVKSRIDGYRELGAAFKAVNDGLRSTEVQTVLLAQSARQIRNAARAQYGWFPTGSDARAGVKTAVKPEVWSKSVQFKAAQDGFAKQAELFQKTLAGGNPATIRIEARKLGQTCKSCHDSFRAEKD
jgi:cytochrome c556